MVGVFSSDPQVIAVGEEYLHIIAFNFVASGIVFVSSSMFQAMGNTDPIAHHVADAHRRSSQCRCCCWRRLLASPCDGSGISLWAPLVVQLAMNMWLLQREYPTAS